MTSSNAASGIIAGGPPRAAATASASPAGSSPATRSPSRWEQLIPAACMNVASPSSSAQSASQVARSREVSSRGRPAPAVQRADQRVRQVPAARIGPAADQPGPGEPGRGQQPGVVAGQHRHRARPGAAHGDHDTPPDRHATSVPRTSRRSPRISPAPAPRQTSPAARIRRPVVGWASASARYPPISAGLYGCLGPFPGQRQVRRIQVRHHPAADEPQVGAQRPPRHPRQPRRAPGEPLGYRRVQHHLRHRLQAQPERVIGQLARRPQQVLRPLPPLRPGLAITSRANAAACGDTDDGRHRPI